MIPIPRRAAARLDGMALSYSSCESAIDAVPVGAWAAGVSGGADSVALLSLLRTRPVLRVHVVHLDHETRRGESAADSDFVRELAVRWGLPFTTSRRSDVEVGMAALPANVSARYRAARMALFRKVVDENALGGVILAHHANDQAETILHRLLRGSGPSGLVGMRMRARVGGLLVLRPLLEIPGSALREHLHSTGQSWREDSSNASDDYLRNRLRRLLSSETALGDAILELGQTCGALSEWARTHAPMLPEAFAVSQVQGLPDLLATEAAARWLTARGIPAAEVTPAVIARLLSMVRDAASSRQAHFPGRLLVRRMRGIISAGDGVKPAVGA